MSKKPEGEVYQWRCFHCGKWNNVEELMCTVCSSPSSTAVSYRVHAPLTKEEKDFYNHLVPRMLSLMERMASSLEVIERWLKNMSSKT